LREQIVAQNPRARTIFISGYDLSDYAERLQGHRFMAKPIEAHALIEGVRQELAVLAALGAKTSGSSTARRRCWCG
jgi:hypothetical protein